MEAYEAGDSSMAVAYAKVLMLKAMSIWSFPQPVETVENSFIKIFNKLKILKILIFDFFEFFRNLKFKIFEFFCFFTF
jgi:hypothetical protein